MLEKSGSNLKREIIPEWKHGAIQKTFYHPILMGIVSASGQYGVHLSYLAV